MTAGLRRWLWWGGGPVRAALIGMIRLYRITLGQLLGGQCRFYPSCSSYAEAAIRNRGWIRGSALAIWRIARCNPFGAGGLDYAPERPAPVTDRYDDVNNSPYDSVIHGANGAPDDVGLDQVETFERDRAETSGVGS